ncbi:LamG-like jellyroll fold domain-containing protein [Planctomycetota bacterium]
MEKKNLFAAIVLVSLLLIGMPPVQAQVVPPAGIVSWWPGDGNADDISGSIHGTLMNGATFAAGKVGQAFSLDGLDDYIAIPYDSSYNLSSFTLQAWVKFTQSGSAGCIIGRPSGGNPTYGYSFFRLDNTFGKLGGGVQGEGQSYSVSVSTGPTTFADDNWHLCSFVRDVLANEISIYIDDYFYKSYPDSSPGDMEHNENGIFIGSIDGGINFLGNIETRDFLDQPADVIVCDGFVGNVILKLTEGLTQSLFKAIKREIAQQNPHLLVQFQPVIDQLYARHDYNEFGAAPLMGVNGTCMICHGSSDARAIKSAIVCARQHVKLNINEKIAQEVQKKT